MPLPPEKKKKGGEKKKRGEKIEFPPFSVRSWKIKSCKGGKRKGERKKS